MKNSKEAVSVHHDDGISEDRPDRNLNFDLKELRVAGIHVIIREHKLVFVMKDWNTIDLMEEFQPLGEKLENELNFSHSDNRNLYSRMLDIIHTRTILRRLEAARIEE